MSNVYRFGPWFGAIAAAIAALIVLLMIDGEDPISSAFISMGRYAVSLLLMLFVIGLYAERRGARNSRARQNSLGDRH